jgi:hypothetical protein
MAIIARDTGTKDFEPAPEGLFAAVCCDVVDRGIVESQWGKSHKIQVRWQLDGHSDAGLRDDGKQWLVTRQFTLSLHEKAALRAFLVSWRGKQFTPEELKGFDVENVIGAPCMIQIIRQFGPDGQRVFANVQNIMPLPKGMQKPLISDYVRVVDRDGIDGGPAAEYYEDEQDAMPF